MLTLQQEHGKITTVCVKTMQRSMHMAAYRIITDSSCDLTQEMADALELAIAPLSVNHDGEVRANYLDGRELNGKEFYQSMRDGAMYSTSAANPTLWRAVAEPVLQNGEDVLILAFSSGLSTTCNAYIKVSVLDLSESLTDSVCRGCTSCCCTVVITLETCTH